MELQIQLPPKYSDRLRADYDGQVRVYADSLHTVLLGVVPTQQQALQLLDAYDGMLVRRQTIINKIDERTADALRSAVPNLEDLQ